MWEWVHQLSLKTRAEEALSFLKIFAKHPVNATRKLPDWPIETSILLVVLCSAFSALLTGLVARSLVPLISGIILVPIMTLICLAIAAFFYHYIFIFLYDRSIDTKKIFQVLAVASIPFMIFRFLGFWISPILLIGVAFTSVLMVVGFVDNFYLPKNSIMKLIGLFFCLSLCSWIYSTINSTSRISDYKDRISDDSMKVLDAEFNKDSD